MNASIYDYIQLHLSKHFSSLNLNEHRLLAYLDTIAPSDPELRQHFYHEFFNGAYIFIPDDGQMHQALNIIDANLKERKTFSSHFSLDPQYSFQGELVKECLFGTNKINEQKGSWLQLEAYGTNLLQLPAHLYSYLKYVFTGYNQGPHGISLYTEKNPLMIFIHDHKQDDVTHLNSPIHLSEVLMDGDSIAGIQESIVVIPPAESGAIQQAVLLPNMPEIILNFGE